MYAVTAEEVEFWNADHDRRHTRLPYRRAGAAWSRRRLWP
ncbi:pyridoxine 5'-phosphate oxidase C-terminal domain-containing protein [Nonomuraea antimicrobica]